MSAPSPEQDKALIAIQQWLGDSSRWMFHLAGYAGTGKTFLLHHFINSLPAPPLCLAPTGKAASVLQKRLTSAKVTTIHNALYKPVPPSTTKLLQLEQAVMLHPDNETLKRAITEEKADLAKKRVGFTGKDRVEIKQGDLVIVDECSMVTTRMREDLHKLGAKVLFVGDSGQLPPVGDEGFFSKHTPDAMLSTVQRQALDSPIVRLSVRLRDGVSIPDRIKMDALERMPRKDLDPGAYIKHEQVLTGSNRWRTSLNRRIRKMMGYVAPLPVAGEKLICLKNDRQAGRPYINGVQCTCLEPMVFDPKTGDWYMGFSYEGMELTHQPVYGYNFLVYNDPKVEPEPYHSREGLVEMDYGYAITVHKSQGSEWESVLVVDDGMNKDQREFRKRWLYTAVTRAKSKLTWVY